MNKKKDFIKKDNTINKKLLFLFTTFTISVIILIFYNYNRLEKIKIKYIENFKYYS